MITTGIIRQINLSSSTYKFNKYLVEVTFFKSPGDDNTKHYTFEANCCLPGGLYQSYKVDDMVYIGFVNNDLSLPVILGRIYKGIEDNHRTYAQLDNLTVANSVQLPESTVIGEITYDKLKVIAQQTFSFEEQLDQVNQNFIFNSYSAGELTTEDREKIAKDIEAYKDIIILETVNLEVIPFKYRFSKKYTDTLEGYTATVSRYQTVDYTGSTVRFKFADVWVTEVKTKIILTNLT